MKKLFYSLVAFATLTVGCTKDESPETPNNGGGDLPQTEQTGVTEFGASLPEGTRTTLEGNQVIWTEGDQISVWSDTEPVYKTFNFTGFPNESDKTNGNFKLASTGYGVSGNKYYAIYPAFTTSTPSITIPEIQKFNGEKNFSTNVNPMFATGSDEGTDDNRTKLEFTNLCGILVIQTYMTEPDRDESITSIELSTSRAIAGTMPVTVSADGKPTLGTFTNSSKTITLDCDIPQPISKSKAAPNTFYVVLPAGSYSMRLTFYIDGQLDAARTVTRNKTFTVTAGDITYVGANVDVLPAPPTPPATYKVGDLYPNNENPKGVVFQVNNADAEGAGTSGKIIALKDCQGLYSWGANNTSVRPVNADNGLLNMNIVLATNNISTYPAFNACYVLRNDEDKIEWYLPSTKEGIAILDANQQISPVLEQREDAEDLNSFIEGEDGEEVLSGYWASDLYKVPSTTTYRPQYFYVSVSETEDDIVVENKVGRPTFTNTQQRKVRAVAQFDTTK